MRSVNVKQKSGIIPTSDSFTYDNERGVYIRTLIEEGDITAVPGAQTKHRAVITQEYDAEGMKSLRAFLNTQLEQLKDNHSQHKKTYKTVKKELSRLPVSDFVKGFFKVDEKVEVLENEKEFYEDRVPHVQRQLDAVLAGIALGPELPADIVVPAQTEEEMIAAKIREAEQRLAQLREQEEKLKNTPPAEPDPKEEEE